MKLTVLYDNEGEHGFQSGWGFSCLIEHEDHKVLFDTGWDGRALFGNMTKMGIEPTEIDIIVLSHSHWDHSGGLSHIIHERATVHVPSAFTKHLKEELRRRAHLIEVTGAHKIAKDIHTLGELGDDFKEQSLALHTRKGIFVLTGCAHPGLQTILTAASSQGNVFGVMGGFHDFRDIGSLAPLSMIVPCHCTVKKQEILEMYPLTAKMGKTGLVVCLD